MKYKNIINIISGIMVIITSLISLIDMKIINFINNHWVFIIFLVSSVTLLATFVKSKYELLLTKIEENKSNQKKYEASFHERIEAYEAEIK